MSNADAFRSLARDMASAQDKRTKPVAELKKETKDLHEGFDKEHSEKSAELKSELAKIKLETAKREKKRGSEVKSLGFRKDSAETTAARRELVATMQAKRGVAVAPPSVKRPKAVAEKSPVVEVAEEEEMLAEEVIPEKLRLEEEILSLISEHPEGIRLTEIAERAGVPKIKVGNITRMLVHEGEIRKEGLLYFAV